MAYNELPDLYEIVPSFQDADIIDLCNATYKHFPDAHLFLGKGKHIISEKPICESLWQLRDLIDREATSAGRVFPISQFRFVDNCFEKEREYWYDRSPGYFAGGHSWRANWATAFGGALLTQGYHVADYWAQHEIAKVRCVMSFNHNRAQVESDAFITTTESEGRTVDWAVHVAACAGNTEIGDSALGMKRQLHDIALAIHSDEPSPVTMQSVWRTMELITACYYSALNGGEEVKLPLLPTHPAYRGWLPLVLRRLLLQGSFQQTPEEPSDRLGLQA